MYLGTRKVDAGACKGKTPPPPARCVPGSYTFQLIIFTHEIVGYLVL